MFNDGLGNSLILARVRLLCEGVLRELPTELCGELARALVLHFRFSDRMLQAVVASCDAWCLVQSAEDLHLYRVEQLLVIVLIMIMIFSRL